ncbi:hypothetical protein GDO86_001911 [Hymenochirus boettgeri]|uniref:Carbonic anhydrase n=1 Tax=Hymenochirus boettgeri TaxID=247094 RepID=A0A8T2KHF2_9PIPI|nr:hypothetical protein GDO86_001911 [Hymenochirus boettgeri]
MKLYQLCIHFFSLPLVVQGSGGGVWCYSAQSSSCGPDHWKDINHNCGGENQSPINIEMSKVKRDSLLGDIIFQGYNQSPPGPWKLMNDGHSVLLSLSGEVNQRHLNISGAGLPSTYQALQFHFHWGSSTKDGSEHLLNGKQYPMELHIVHMNAKYKNIAEAKKDTQGLAVLGFFFTVSDTDNHNYDMLVAAMKNLSLEGEYVELPSTFPMETLLPPHNKLSRYYRYQGSLTTPDCSEAVVWTVFEDPISISQRQLKILTETAHFTAHGEALVKMSNNFRPPQPLKKRKVWASREATVNHSNVICHSLFNLSLVIVTAQTLLHF